MCSYRGEERGKKKGGASAIFREGPVGCYLTFDCLWRMYSPTPSCGYGCGCDEPPGNSCRCLGTPVRALLTTRNLGVNGLASLS